jgi:hypothetical protein
MQITIIDLVMNTAEASGGMCGHITIANGSTEENRDFHDANALSRYLTPGIYTILP